MPEADPATLTDPISRTKPNSRSSTIGSRRNPTGVPRNCIASAGNTCAGRDISSLISGNRRSSSSPTAVAIACACSRVRPGDSLPSTLNAGLPRSFKVGSVNALTGTYALGAMKPVTDR